jgi:galactokinase/mevalonate kinase-like predicted kinase
VRLTADLVSNAHRLRAALLAGDLPAVGACLSTYWTQKKAMAGTYEPPRNAKFYPLPALMGGSR